MRFVLAATLLVGAHVAFAQPAPDESATPATPAIPAPGSITGHVVDALGRPVRNAVVVLEGTDTQAKTDRLGNFKLALPPGTAMGATVVVDHDGYDTAIANITGPVIDEVVLLKSGTHTETIEVKGEKPPDAPGAAAVDRTELQRIPGTGGDVVRALTIMPGVVNLQLPLGYNGVVIRGSSPQDSKILVDDFDIPVLFHNIGFRAILPAESIESLDYIPGGFDVAYGRASSGIVKLTTRPGSDQRTEQIEISAIDGSIIAQGKIGDKTSYMIGFRRSVIDFLLPHIIPASVDLSLTTVPSYYDEQFRIDHELSSKWHLALSSLGTDDKFEIVGSKEANADAKRFYNETRFIRLTADARYHDGPWSANLALSGILPQFIFELGLYQEIKSFQPGVTPRAEVTRTADEFLGLKNVVWRIGGEANIGRTTLDLALPNEQREGETQTAYDPKDTSESFHGHIWTPDFAEWTALQANLDPRIRLTVGMRLDQYGRDGENAIQPRGDLSIKLTHDWTARLSAGGYSRPPEYQSELLAKNLKAERSTQTIAGLQYQPFEGLRVQGSLYYTDRYNLIVHAADGVSLVNDGRGTTDGAELLATYRGGPWFAWLSYSYSHSTRVDMPGEDRRLFDFDQPHSLNVAGSWKHGRWTFGSRFQLYSGLPFTPATGSIFDSDRNLYLPTYGPVNSDRAPMHHQLDIRIDYLRHWGPVQLTYFLDVQNVYLNDSVVTYFYSYDYSQRAAFKSIPIIPSAGVRAVF
ncbi:MAG TPA: TonB-dependent receptor [Kofleriaceae bacterium]